MGAARVKRCWLVVLRSARNGQSYCVTYTLDEQAEHAAAILKQAELRKKPLEKGQWQVSSCTGSVFRFAQYDKRDMIICS